MSKATPQVQSGKSMTDLEHAIKIDEDESNHRAFRIALEQTTTMESEKPDQLLPSHQRNSESKKSDHISNKIYLFPESFNALRRELEENYPTFFNSVNPEIGVSPAWAMVLNAPAFVGMCNGALDFVVQFDSENVDGICKKFLNGFRKLRGVSAL